MAKFLPIAPRNDNRAIFPPGKKYDTPDFVTTVLSMREKLYELQGGLQDTEEPTQENDILKRWKASNGIIHGNMNVSNLFFVKSNPFILMVLHCNYCYINLCMTQKR